MRLLLVRHGDAHAGFHGVIGGVRGCCGLTDLGRRQADALSARLAGSPSMEPDVLLASTLPRAIETAQIVGLGLDLDLAAHDDDLCEVRPGEADGLTWAEYGMRHGSFDMEAEPDRVFAGRWSASTASRPATGSAPQEMARDLSRRRPVRESVGPRRRAPCSSAVCEFRCWRARGTVTASR